MQKIITLNTNRSEYDIREAAKSSITVKELIMELEQFDGEAKIVFSNDNGYTYGYVGAGYIDEHQVETEEEEEYKERMEELHNEIENLDYEYETQYDRDITEEEYRKERENLFELYNITEEEYNKYNF